MEILIVVGRAADPSLFVYAVSALEVLRAGNSRGVLDCRFHCRSFSDSPLSISSPKPDVRNVTWCAVKGYCVTRYELGGSGLKQCGTENRNQGSKVMET
jgi:hypothetical protein